ncbi:helix-turn-helix domain-containing protein [Corallococcus sp. CA053C]|uniref:helix-turn-helix domain-containing protein n=1 Tax=Corallococcus sp. CA053C TaxID=2316732 RepID=UPI0034CE6691
MCQGRRWEAQRATIVLWSAQAESARIIAQTLGVTPRTVYNCRRRWRLRGLKGLAPAACFSRGCSPSSARPSIQMRSVSSGGCVAQDIYGPWRFGAPLNGLSLLGLAP